MKILFISPFNPYPPQTGGERRIYSLVKYLARSCELVLAIPEDEKHGDINAKIKIVRHVKRSRWQQLIDPRFLIRLAAVIRKEKPDHILLAFPWHGIHVFFLSRLSGVPFSVDAHNLEYKRQRDLGFCLWRVLKLYENWVLKRASQVFCVSKEDQKKMLQLGVEVQKLTIAPNGVDRELFRFNLNARRYWRQRLGLGKNEAAFLFFGSGDYLPNRVAVELIQQEIVPRLKQRLAKFTVLVAGRNTKTSKEISRLRNLGFVDDLVGLISASDVVLVPLTVGGGSRLKILEAVACGVPVVSTSIGAAGLERNAIGDSLVLVNDWEMFAEKLVSFAQTSKVPLEVPADFWQIYGWEAIAKKIITSLS